MKNNVYISASETKDKLKNLTLFLPGCKANVMKRSDGSFLVYHVEMCSEYMNAVNSQKAIGLYDVNKMGKNRWEINYIASGQIKTNSEMPIVVISDGGKEPDDAVVDCANHATGAPIGGGAFIIDKKGFNMHYHKGDKIGGVRNLQQALHSEYCPKLHASALQLADSMRKAQNIKDVSWITQAGGSGVMTQALRILKDRGIAFHNSNHNLYFSHLTTDLSRAQALASDLGFQFARTTHRVNKLNFDELVGGLNFGGDITTALCRKRYDPNYSVLQMTSDLYNSTGSNWKTVSTLGAKSAAISAAIGMGGSAIALPASIAVASAVAGTGKALFKAWLPERYRRLASKL